MWVSKRMKISWGTGNKKTMFERRRKGRREIAEREYRQFALQIDRPRNNALVDNRIHHLQIRIEQIVINKMKE